MLIIMGWITFKDIKFQEFHRFLQNLENIYPQNCKIVYSFTAYYYLLILESLFTKYPF